jgi:hypothetical protein
MKRLQIQLGASARKLSGYWTLNLLQGRQERRLAQLPRNAANLVVGTAKSESQKV